MRTVVLSLILMIAVTRSVTASDFKETSERHTLEAALLLARLDPANVPIVLTAVAPDGASQGVEGWTTYSADGKGDRIFVYTGSRMFRCASWPLSMSQCQVRLASVVVHETWHFRHGRDEIGAYEAQIAFLLRNGAAIDHVKSVRMARDRVVASARGATGDDRTSYPPDKPPAPPL